MVKKQADIFCNLENRNYTSKSMCFIQRNNGDVVLDQEEIIEETKNFYVNLYSQQETIDVDLKRVAPNAPLLAMENREIIEGQITYTEAHTAVRAMKNNTSLGSDGYTSKSYKLVFRDIGHFLVWSINYGFKNKQMSVTQRQGIITCIPKEDKPKHLLKPGDLYHYSIRPTKLLLRVLQIDFR